MAIYGGTDKFKGAYQGTDKIKQVFQGTDLIFQAVALEHQMGNENYAVSQGTSTQSQYATWEDFVVFTEFSQFTKVVISGEMSVSWGGASNGVTSFPFSVEVLMPNSNAITETGSAGTFNFGNGVGSIGTHYTLELWTENQMFGYYLDLELTFSRNANIGVGAIVNPTLTIYY